MSSVVLLLCRFEKIPIRELHKERTEAEVSTSVQHKWILNWNQHQKLTRAKNKNRAVCQWFKILFSDESKVWISFGNPGSRVWSKSGEKHNPHFLKATIFFRSTNAKRSYFEKILLISIYVKRGRWQWCFPASNQIVLFSKNDPPVGQEKRLCFLSADVACASDLWVY